MSESGKGITRIPEVGLVVAALLVLTTEAAAIRVAAAPQADAPPGWCDFTPSAGARIVYVSSSVGDDAADGLSPSSPKRTISAGKALLRDGSPDWLLLKKGDTWDEALGQWSKSGVSYKEPMLISSYGTGARPRIRPAAGMDGFAAYDGSPHDIALVDLHFLPQQSGSGNAVSWLTEGGNLLVEGCLMEQFDMAIVLQNGANFAVRRNVMADLATSGMYVSNVATLLIEQNVIDRCGLAAPTIFKHGIYLDNEGNTTMVVRDNIISNTSSHGLQLRPGGRANNNLFVKTSIALQLGGGDSWSANPNGVTGQLKRNVILDGKDIDGANQRGWGILLQNVAAASVEDNVIANAPAAHNPRPIELDAWESGQMIHDVAVADNVVYGWGGSSVRIKGAPGPVDNVLLYRNELQNKVSQGWLLEIDQAVLEVLSSENRFYSAYLPAGLWFFINGIAMPLAGLTATMGDGTSVLKEMDYPNPNVSLAAYNASLGRGASHDEFMAEARKQSIDHWRPEYTAMEVNAWVRAGFGR